MIEDRYYQTACGQANLADYDKGVRRMLNVMATGAGKTICFARLPKLFKERLTGQMIVLAHTDELVMQNADKIQQVNPGLKIGIEMAGQHADPVCDEVISGSVQTLGRSGSKRLERFNRVVVDKIVVDEAHHSTSDAYRRVLDWSGVLEPSTHRLLLGVTATPQRADGTSLESIYEKISYVYGIRQAISDGWLSRVRGYRISTDTSLADVSKSAGDFVKSELSAAVNTPERNQRVVDVWKKLAPGKRTLAFTVDIQHAQDLAKKFEDSGVAAEAVWGDDPQRQEKIARHRSGATTVLCNCALVIEGYDDPAIEVVLLTRPTASHVLYSQMIGRMTRLFKGKEYGLAIDFVDATRDFSLVTLPTLMGLQNTLDLQGQDLLDAVETLEALQAEHPTVDFSKLDLLSNAAQVIEQVDLMEVRFPPEVEANSHLVWFKAIDGGYKMLIPKEGEGKTGYVRVFEDMLGQWQLVGTINGDDFHGKRTTIEDVFKVADEQIRARVNKVTIQYLLREATWHNNPVTNGQKQLLTRLFPKRQFPWPQMSSGQASKMINERLARRA